MTNETRAPTPTTDLEEAAQGQSMFHAPGGDKLLDQAREDAEASGWLPPRVAEDWPPAETRDGITRRRLDIIESMGRLETVISRATGQPHWAEEVRDALEELDRALQRHVVETELNGGLFSELLERSPQLAPDIESMSRDHEELLRRCRETIEIVDVWGRDGSAQVRRRALALLGQLARHRQKGAELLYDAYNVDVATGD